MNALSKNRRNMGMAIQKREGKSGGVTRAEIRTMRKRIMRKCFHRKFLSEMPERPHRAQATGI